MLLPGQDPTVAQLKANMSHSGGRGDTMLSELVRLGSTLLPPFVEELRRDPQYQLDLPDIHEWELEGCQIEKAFPFVTFGLSSEVTWTGNHGNSESWTVPIKIWHPLPATLDEKLNALALAQVLWQVYANKSRCVVRSGRAHGVEPVAQRRHHLWRRQRIPQQRLRCFDGYRRTVSRQQLLADALVRTTTARFSARCYADAPHRRRPLKLPLCLSNIPAPLLSTTASLPCRASNPLLPKVA